MYPGVYRQFHKLPQTYTANHATFPIQMYTFTVCISCNAIMRGNHGGGIIAGGKKEK